MCDDVALNWRALAPKMHLFEEKRADACGKLASCDHRPILHKGSVMTVNPQFDPAAANPMNPVSAMSPVSPLNAMSRPTSPVSKGRHSAEVQELLAVPARFVSGLPMPVCLHLSVPGAPVPVMLWSGPARPTQSTHPANSESRGPTPVLADIVVFDGAELDAMISACESDRLWHADFLGLCFEKWRRPDVPLRAADLLAGANPEPAADWTLGRVLARLGIEVDAIELDAQPVPRPLYAAA
jgi:hypothetical protein